MKCRHMTNDIPLLVDCRNVPKKRFTLYCFIVGRINRLLFVFFYKKVDLVKYNTT